MSIDVDIPAVMRTLTKNQKTIKGSGENIEQLIESIEALYPGMKDRLLSDGDLNQYVNIFVNEDDIRFGGDLKAKVKEGDLVTILPAVAGG